MSSVLIIGGGHIGIGCAHYLLRDGHDVTVIDQGGIGDGCSHANCGFVAPSHVIPLTTPGALWDGLKSLFHPTAPFRVKPQLRWALYRWMFEFGRRCTQRRMLEAGKVLQAILDVSRHEYLALLDDPALDCEWREKGLLFVFGSNEALQKFAETDALLTENFELSARYIPGSGLQDLEPALRDGLAGAFLYENDALLRPDQLNTTWSKRLEEQGVRFIENCELQSIEKDSGEISAVSTSQGQMTADHFVFATGAWSSRFAADLECDIPVEPGKGYSVTMTNPEVMPEYPMIFEEAHIAVTPFANNYRIGSMMEFAGFDDTIAPSRIQQLQDLARPFLKTPAGPAIEEEWYGWRPMTWDSLPIVGRVPRLPNALLATGHNMLGLTLAPVTGKMIADLVAERPSELPLEALSPARF
jgi:D-amino-acid dehydrogenase